MMNAPLRSEVGLDALVDSTDYPCPASNHRAGAGHDPAPSWRCQCGRTITLVVVESASIVGGIELRFAYHWPAHSIFAEVVVVNVAPKIEDPPRAAEPFLVEEPFHEARVPVLASAGFAWSEGGLARVGFRLGRVATHKRAESWDVYVSADRTLRFEHPDREVALAIFLRILRMPFVTAEWLESLGFNPN